MDVVITKTLRNKASSITRKGYDRVLSILNITPSVFVESGYSKLRKMGNCKLYLARALQNAAIFFCMAPFKIMADAGPENPDSDNKKRALIEEIVVTAQRREQLIADVPVSLSVISDQFIAEQGLTDVEDVLAHTPNMQLQSRSGSGTAAGVSPVCRGFSTDQTNRAFESPCGVAIDGVPYARAAYFGAALFDIQRVEVMRGPQGTTFGKNTTAGLVHLITKDPIGEFGGYLDLQYGERDRRRVEAAVGGVLLPEFLDFRIAGFKDDRDGFMKNTTAQVAPAAPERPGLREGEGYRAKLGFPNVFGSELKLTYERVELEVEGMITEVFDVDARLAAFWRRYDPNADFEKDNFINSFDAPAGDTTVIERYQVDWHYTLFDWGIDAVGGFSQLDNTVILDGFADPAPTAHLNPSDIDNPATTLEIRTVSPVMPGLFGLEELLGLRLGQSELLAGLFYQSSKLDPLNIRVEINNLAIAGFLALERREVPSELSPESIETLPAESLEELFGVSGAPEGEWYDILYNEDRETEAAYAQFQWHFTGRWSLQTGVRYSQETKDATWEQRLSDPAPILSTAGWQEYTAQRSIEETNFQPKVTLRFNPTDNINLFLRWARGFKGGGFNTWQHGATDLTYDSETVTEWAFDAKLTLLDGAMRWNTSVFHMFLEDFQVLTLASKAGPTDISLSPKVTNAGGGRAQGLESDLMYRPVQWLTVIATLGLNDTEYRDFLFGACPMDEQERDRCDNSGKPFQFTPKWNATLTLNTRYPLSFLGLDNINFTTGATVEYYSSQYMHPSLDERDKAPAIYLLKASLGFEDVGQEWSFRLTAENLIDEDTPTSLSTTHSKYSHQTPRPPRSIYGQFRWSF